MATKYEGESDYQNENMGESQAIMDTTGEVRQTSDIKIEVCNPRVKDDTFNKYISYTVKGVDKEGEFEVTRRYSDFDRVRSYLLAQWPGCYIPPLPPKALNSMEAQFVKERRRYLQLFCQKVANLPLLHYSPGYQEFLRNKNANIEKLFQPLMKVDYGEILNRYEANFSAVRQNEYNLSLVKRISDFKTFLRKVQAHNENVKKHAKAMVVAKNSFYKQFGALNVLMTNDYEKNVFSQYHGKVDSKNVLYGHRGAEIAFAAEKLAETSKGPSIEYLEEWYKAESREFDAFIDAINQHENYQNLKIKASEKQKSDSEDLQKVLSGKSTMKGVLFRKSKDEEKQELEKQLEKSNTEVDQLSTLNDWIILLLAHEQIVKFKDGKMKPYYNSVKACSTKELETLTNMENYWKGILADTNLTTESAE